MPHFQVDSPGNVQYHWTGVQRARSLASLIGWHIHRPSSLGRFLSFPHTRRPVTSMRILHSESSTGFGGRELAVLGITEGLAARGHHVVLAVQPGSRLQQLAWERGLLCEPLVMSKLRFPFVVQAFRRIIQRHRIEVIHTHSSRDRWMGTLAAHLSTPRPVVALGRHHCGPVPDSMLNRLLYGRLSHCIVTTGGERLRQELIQYNGFSPSQVVAIPTGVDLERFDPAFDGNAVRAEFHVPADAFLRGYKGLDYVIEAAPLVLAKAPHTRFMIVGDGPDHDHLAAHINRRGLDRHIHMTGHRDDVPQVMAALDLLVVPSIGTETLTQVIPQALAMEKPVIATEMGSIPDIVINEETGLLIPPGSAQALAEGILWVIAHRDRARQLGQAGRRLVMERYSTESTLDRTEFLYRTLLEGRQRP